MNMRKGVCGKFFNGTTIKELKMTTLLHSLLLPIIQRQRPQFKPDRALSARQWLAYLWPHFVGLLRAGRLLLFFRFPPLLFFGRGVRLQHLHKITFGSGVRLEEGVYLSAFGQGLIQLGKQVRIGAYSRLITSTSPGQLGQGITIGDNVGIGEFAYLGGAGGLEIGSDCIIGQYFSCHPENHCFSKPDLLIRQQGVSRKGISIERNCWIGAKVTVLDGVRIGQGSVIAAGAVITKDIPPYSVAGGVPARVIRPRFPHQHEN